MGWQKPQGVDKSVDPVIFKARAAKPRGANGCYAVRAMAESEGHTEEKAKGDARSSIVVAVEGSP